MVFFDDVTKRNDRAAPRCVEHVRPLAKASSPGGDFESDLGSGKVARYNFITPNMCNDMHTSCPPLENPTKQGDERWLAKWIPQIMASGAYQDAGAIFVTWDESEYAADCPTADCPIGMFVLSPLAKGGGYTSTVPYDHSSTLRTFQEIFRVSPFLRAAASATDLSDLFKPESPRRLSRSRWGAQALARVQNIRRACASVLRGKDRSGSSPSPKNATSVVSKLVTRFAADEGHIRKKILYVHHISRGCRYFDLSSTAR